jgi:ABC-2 type transport system permease protein
MRVLPAIVRHIYRQERRRAVIWGSVFGTFVWVSTVGYAASYPKLSDRLAFARSLGTNVGIRAIFGPARNLATVQGFTGWRCGTTFALLGAAWGTLLATKILRGDEEEGRAELLYAGPVTRAGGIRQSLGGLFVAWSVLFATVLSGIVAVGVIGGYFALGAGAFFSLVACGGAAMGIGLGALTSQLAITRRAASSIAGGVFSIAFILRAIGETVDGSRWVLWLSPVSWLDRTRPLTGSRFAPLLLVIVFVLVCTTAAAALARRRDLGGAILPSRDTAEAHTRLLSSGLGLSMRLERPSIIGWGGFVFVGAAVFGTVSSAISESLGANKTVSDIFARMGSELSARGYVGLTFVILGSVVSANAAAHVAATRKEESEGRLEFLAAAPLARSRWVAGRVTASVVTLGMIGLAAGLGGWLGVAASGGQIALGTMVLAGINIVPPGLVTLGVGTLVHGVAARAAVSMSYLVVVWSLLVEIVGSVVALPRFVADSSLIHHVAAAPLVNPNWTTNASMLAIGLVCAALGAAALQRRDLQPG